MCKVQLTIWARYTNSAQVAQIVGAFVHDYKGDTYNIKIVQANERIKPAHKVEIIKDVKA